MNIKLKEYLRLLLVPIGLLAVYLTMAFLWKVFDLPSDDQMILIVKNYFNNYGIYVVFVGALIEGFFIVGQYFPGGFIIFLGVISSVGDISRAVAVVSVTSFAFFIAYTLNYFVGKYGWYKILERFGFGHSLEVAKNKLEKQGLNAVIFGYWEPNLASIIATAAGILKISFQKFSFYSLFGVIIWNIFWGVLVYTLGDNALKIIGIKYVLIIFGVWILVLLLKKFISGKNSLLNLSDNIAQKNRKAIIFDWSGVVRDAALHQLWVANFILKKFGVGEIAMEEFRENWEQPYLLFYKKYLPTGFSSGAQSLVYREAIFHKDCPNSPAVSGMVELINKLKVSGSFIAVVSSDLPDTLLPELKAYGLENVFDKVVFDVHDKFDAVEGVIKDNNLNPGNTYFVGDSNHEIDVSREAGIKSIAVTWGFTSKSKLMTHNPDYIVDSIQELERVIL